MRRNHKAFARLAAWVVLFLYGIIGWVARADGWMEVHFIDVGQGDAAVILCEGEVLMIDGGNAADSRCIYSYLREQLRIAHIDYMIATHPHEDHIGGLPGALNACSVGKIYSPVAEYDSDAFRALLTYAAKQGLALTVPMAGDGFHVGSADVQFLSPGREFASENDLSLVVRITYGETALLFAGDAEWEAEREMVAAGYDLSADLLKVGHHGSETSSSYVFLREVLPEYVVISVGKGNAYGHPDEAVLSRLRDAGAQVFRTDLHGTIICILDEQGFSIITEKGA